MKFTKYQIALQYFPESIDKPSNAVDRLRKGIQRNKELYRKLLHKGYNPRSKTFNKCQLDLIYEFLGEP